MLCFYLLSHNKLYNNLVRDLEQGKKIITCIVNRHKYMDGILLHKKNADAKM